MVMSFAVAMVAAAASMSNELMTKIFLGTGGRLNAVTASAFSLGLDQALRVSTVIVLIAAVLSLITDDRPEAAPGGRRPEAG
jgi:hypothetical protein